MKCYTCKADFDETQPFNHSCVPVLLAERDAYREAGAKLIYEVHTALYFQTLLPEECMAMLDNEAKAILEGGV